MSIDPPPFYCDKVETSSNFELIISNNYAVILIGDPIKNKF